MDSNKNIDKESNTHLFVLTHGLWGGPNHLLTIEKLVKELLPECTHDTIVTLKPSNFTFWKTYDGLDLNGRKIIEEILYEIETLKERDGLKVTKISILGYSLGGLLSRYIIGLLDEMKFFDHVQPIFFSTFATPHVGIEFFKDNVFDRSANRMGRYLFGKSGQQLFITDENRLIIEMADPEKKYFKGLAKFEKHILLANIKNDRTVAFFTSYITQYSPFEDLSLIQIRYLEDLGQSKIGKALVKPKFIDLTKCDVIQADVKFEGNAQEETSFFRSNKIARLILICLIALLLLPIWIPFFLIICFFASLYSLVKIKLVSLPVVENHWNKVRNSVYGALPVDLKDARYGENQRQRRKKLLKQESFKGDTSELTENAMENLMYAEERLSANSPKFKHEEDEIESEIPSIINESNELPPNSESDSQDQAAVEETSFLFRKNKAKLVEINKEKNDETIKNHIDVLQIADHSKFPLFTEKTRLPIGKDKQFIIDSLNKINWIKIPVYIDAWNAHDGIVARRGPRTNPKGTATIGLWCSILRKYLKETQEVNFTS